MKITTVLVIFLVFFCYWAFAMAGGITIAQWIGIPYPFYLPVAFFVPFIPPIIGMMFVDWLYYQSLPDDRFGQ